MIILQSKSHGEIITVCRRIFTTALRNKKISQVLNENTLLYFQSALLVIVTMLLCLKRTHFSESFISRFTPFALQERKINLISATFKLNNTKVLSS